MAEVASRTATRVRRASIRAVGFVVGFLVVAGVSVGLQQWASGRASTTTTTAPGSATPVLHHGDPPRPVRDLTDEEAAAQSRELDAALASVPYRTVGEALDAGFQLRETQEGRNDIHLFRPDRIDARFDAGAPEMLLAASRSRSARLLAIVYWVEQPQAAGPPDGFAGPEDQWHWHGLVCIVGGTPRTGIAADPSDCRAQGGTVASAGGWMLHLWTIGRDNPDGIFAGENPDLHER